MRGGRFELQIELINAGYGKIYNPRDFEIVLKHQSSGETFFLEVVGHDPRFWLPAVTQKVAISGGIPAKMPTGTYDLFVFLPDPSPALRSFQVVNQLGDPSIPKWSPYAIRLANKGVWDEETGFNDLLMDVSISTSAGGADYTGSNWFAK